MLLASCLGVILASVIAAIIFFAVLSSAVSGAVKSLGGGEAKAKSLTTESVLLIDQLGEITDTPNMSDPFSSFGSKEEKSFTLPEILRAIEVARENPSIEAIVLKLENFGSGYATAYEIRQALQRFKESGKKIYSFSDSYTLGNYYISSVADEVYAGPQGMMLLEGLSTSVLYQKGLMQKLGVEPQVFKVGTYKSAVEPLLNDNMSPENRLQIKEMIDGLWIGTTTEMANSRGIDRTVFDEYANEISSLSPIDYAKEKNLVDSLVYRIDLDKVLARKITEDENSKIDYLRVGEVLLHESKSKAADKVAVIYAEGNIVVGTGEEDEENPFSDLSTVINESLVKKLRAAAEDDNIKAVVLRVNSGGGAATTSTLINNEIKNLKTKKPVVISMGNYAASGGYMISAPGNLIVASPYTLTGSIGIFAVIPNIKGTLNKVGLKTETVSTTESGVISLVQPMSDKQKEVMQKFIERGYDDFISMVAEGRGMTKVQVDSIGQGRVWLGNKASELGLVDKIGGLQLAIEEAARLAELSDYRVVHKIDKVNFFEKLFSGNLNSRVNYLLMPTEERITYRINQEIMQTTGIMALPPYPITRIKASSQKVIEL